MHTTSIGSIETSKSVTFQPPTTPREWTPLHIEASSSDITTDLYQLIEDGTPESLDARDDLGRTPLMLAARSKNHTALILLLTKGANFYETDLDGWTALHHAADTGNRRAVANLIQVGAFVGKTALGGTTALHLAAARGHKEVALLLLDKGARPESVDEYGRTPSEVARQQGHLVIAAAISP